MWGKHKSFLKNTGFYFIPFILMTVVAVFFLNRTFSVMECQNMSLMQSRLDDTVNEIETGLSQCLLVADDICIDSALSKKNMNEYGILTQRGIERLYIYSQRLTLRPTIFLSYSSDSVATGEGTSSAKAFAGNTLRLNEESQSTFNECMRSTEAMCSTVLEDKNGKHLLLQVYYFPKSTHIEEKRIGFIIRESVFDDILSNSIGSLNGMILLDWQGKDLVWKNSSVSDSALDEEVNLIEQIRNKKVKGYTNIICTAKYFEMHMYVAVNNSILRGELFKEEIKMIVIGILAFLTLSLFQWWYTNYRYRLLYEVKQLAVSKYPEIKGNGNSDYELIRKVLERDFEKLQKQDEDLKAFRQESLKQLKWLLLNSTVPKDLEIAELMEAYGMYMGGPYYGVIEMKVNENAPIEYEELLGQYTQVVMHYELFADNEKILIIVVSLKNKDDDHKERNEFIQKMIRDIKSAGGMPKRIACGLVYDELTEMHSSQEEASSLLKQGMTDGRDNEEKIYYFDEMAYVTKHVPTITTDLLQQFEECLQERNKEKALDVLTSLMAPPKSMAEDLLIYTRYKVIQTLMEAMQGEDNSVQSSDNLATMITLEDKLFIKETEKVISRFVPVKNIKTADIKSIVAYITEHSDDTELSLKAIALHFDLSERTVSRMMKNACNKTYKEYLNEIRLNKACELLKNTDLDIRDIVRKVGYYDVSSFNRLFKQVFNMTPSEYRINCEKHI